MTKRKHEKQAHDLVSPRGHKQAHLDVGKGCHNFRFQVTRPQGRELIRCFRCGETGIRQTLQLDALQASRHKKMQVANCATKAHVDAIEQINCNCHFLFLDHIDKIPDRIAIGTLCIAEVCCITGRCNQGSVCWVNGSADQSLGPCGKLQSAWPSKCEMETCT